MQSIQPFLMFQEKNAEEAMNFYVSLFADGKVDEIVRYGPHGPGPEGSVVKATFTIAGQRVMCTDSPIRHEFGFTPSFSLFVDFDSEEELRRIVVILAEGGSVLMPLDCYGFSRLFGWVNDRFGVSWQLNLP